MDPQLLGKLKTLQKHYENEGFKILGVFGSYSRNTQNNSSDLDILYDLDQKFINKYQGFSGFSRLAEIKKELEQSFGIDVDIAARSGLSRTGKKYILKELQHV